MSQHTNNSVSRAFSESLLSARGTRSQAEFARYLGIANQQTYQRYESGLVPSGVVLHRIASKLGVTIDALLTEGAPQHLPQPTDKSTAALPAHGVHRLDDETEFTAIINIIAPRLSENQLGDIIKGIISSSVLQKRTKVFWVKLLHAWYITAGNLDEFGIMTTSSKISRRRSQGDQKRASGDASKHAS